MRYFRKLYWIIIISGFLFVLPVKALTISPAKALITTERGDKQNLSIQVYNEGAEAIVIEPVVLGYRQSRDGLPLLDQDIGPAEKWVVFSGSSFELSAGGEQSVDFEINVPEDAYPGSHYLALGVKSSAPTGQVGVASQLACLLTLQVAGTAVEQLDINSFQSAGVVWYKDWTFQVRLKNNGNVELPLSGVIKILDKKDKIVDEQEFYFGNQLLAGAVRNLTPTWSWGEKWLWPGIYQAELVIDYGLTRQQSISNVNIVYIPVWSLIGVVFLLVVIIGLIYFLKRKRK